MELRVRKGGTWTPDGFLFEITGGDLSLDFVNTVDERPLQHPRELIPSFGDYCAWARQVGLISTEMESMLIQKAEAHSDKAEEARMRAVAARECLYGILSRIADQEQIPRDQVAGWNEFVHRAMENYSLEPGREGLEWRVTSDPLDFDSLLWPIIHSAVRILTGPNVGRIRKCGGQNCNWMFLDTSKRGNRRWCDMTVCGNRAKARRFYSRKKDASKQQQ